MTDSKIDCVDLFRISDFDVMIIVDDEFALDKKKLDGEALLYELLKLSEADWGWATQALEKASAGLAESVRLFFDSFWDGVSSDFRWEDVVRGALPSADFFAPEGYASFTKARDEIDSTELRSALEQVVFKHGLCAIVPSNYTRIVEDWRHVGVNGSRPVLVYESVSRLSRDIEDDLKVLGSKSAVCLVDDFIGSQSTCDMAITSLIENASPGTGITGVVYSSHEGGPIIEESAYFERVRKDEEAALPLAFARSAYARYLRLLEEAMVECVHKAFSLAKKNSQVAWFLANKSALEGISEHQAMTEWVGALARVETIVDPSANRDMLMKFSKIICMLDSGEDDIDELLEYETHATFDYSVNSRYEQIAPGDLFLIENQYYLMIGQECDVVKRKEGSRKDYAATLVKVSLNNDAEIENTFWKSGATRYCIAGFCVDPGKMADRKNLCINYGRAYFQPFESLDLCSLSASGRAYLNLEAGVGPNMKDLLPDFRLAHVEELLVQYKDMQTCQNGRGCPAPHVSMLLASPQYQDNAVSFDIQRICRLRRDYLLQVHNAHHQYKMRGALGLFDLSQSAEIVVYVKYQAIEMPITAYVSKIASIVGNKKGLLNRTWWLNLEDIEGFLESASLPIRKFEGGASAAPGVLRLLEAQGIFGVLEKKSKKIQYKKVKHASRLELVLSIAG